MYFPKFNAVFSIGLECTPSKTGASAQYVAHAVSSAAGFVAGESGTVIEEYTPVSQAIDASSALFHGRQK